MPSGINTYFAIDNAVGGSLTDVSTWLDGVSPESEPEELDDTTFQPGVAAPAKNIVAGFRERPITLSVKWRPAADVFFTSIEGLNGLNYSYGPLGSTAGLSKTSGLCNCLSWTGANSTVGAIMTGTVQLNATTRTVGTF
jgi:hypothetical protein